MTGDHVKRCLTRVEGILFVVCFFSIITIIIIISLLLFHMYLVDKSLYKANVSKFYRSLHFLQLTKLSKSSLGQSKCT